MANFKTSNFDLAIRDYSAAINIKDKFVLGYAHRAEAWNEYGNIDKAIDDYEEVVRLDPLFSKAYVNLGHLWFDKKGNLDKAIFSYTKALQIDPSEIRAYINRGDAFLQKGQTEEAISDYYSALEINPNVIGVCNNLAWILATSKSSKHRDGLKAVELALKAINIEPNEFTLSTLAAAYAEIRDFNSAIKCLEQATEMSNDKEQIDRFYEQLKSFQNSRPWRE